MLLNNNSIYDITNAFTTLSNIQQHGKVSSCYLESTLSNTNKKRFLEKQSFKAFNKFMSSRNLSRAVNTLTAITAEYEEDLNLALDVVDVDEMYDSELIELTQVRAKIEAGIAVEDPPTLHALKQQVSVNNIAIVLERATPKECPLFNFFGTHDSISTLLIDFTNFLDTAPGETKKDYQSERRALQEVVRTSRYQNLTLENALNTEFNPLLFCDAYRYMQLKQLFISVIKGAKPTGVSSHRAELVINDLWYYLNAQAYFRFERVMQLEDMLGTYKYAIETYREPSEAPKMDAKEALSFIGTVIGATLEPGFVQEVLKNVDAEVSRASAEFDESVVDTQEATGELLCLEQKEISVEDKVDLGALS